MYEIAKHATAIGALIFVVACLALGATQNLIPFRSSRSKDATMLSIVAVAGMTFWLTRPATPPLSVVNGTYRNTCCDPITLHNGVLITSDLREPFKLRLMKYGLDTYMQRRVGVQNGKIVLDRPLGSGGFLFSDDLHAFTLCSETCGAGHEFEFRRS